MTIKDNQGVQKFITDKTTGNVWVVSDYLSDKELSEAKKEFQNLSNQLQSQIANESSLIQNPKENQIGIQSVVGSYAWSVWQNHTVTTNGKATVQIVTAAILTTIPHVGWAAGALAAVWIQYNLKTGYFKTRIGTALNSDPNWYWQKSQVRLYKDSARTNLLSDQTSTAQKLLVPTS